MKFAKNVGLPALLLAVVTTALLLALNFARNRDVPRIPVKVTVMLSWYPGAENAFLYYGLEKGVFKKYGLDIDVQISKGSSIVASALSSQKIDFGFISSDYLITAAASGTDLKALFTLYHETPVTIYSLPASNITKVTDLRGKKLAVLAKSAAYPQVLNYLELKGVKNFEEVSGSGAFTDITEGKADAAMDYTHYAPVTLEVMKKIKPNEIRLADDFKNFYGTSIATTGKIIGNRPVIVEKFTCAMIESLDAALSDRNGAVNALVAANENILKKEVMDVAVKKVDAMIVRDTEKLGVGYMTREGWANTARAVETLSKIDLSKLDIAVIFDATFFQRARDGQCKGI